VHFEMSLSFCVATRSIIRKTTHNDNDPGGGRVRALPTGGSRSGFLHVTGLADSRHMR